MPASVKYAFNVKDEIDFMFYNHGVDAHFWCLGPDDIEKLKKQHLAIAVYHEPGKNDIPSYVENYDSLYIINAILK